jgi:hypothetical protein
MVRTVHMITLMAPSRAPSPWTKPQSPWYYSSHSLLSCAQHHSDRQSQHT